MEEKIDDSYDNQYGNKVDGGEGDGKNRQEIDDVEADNQREISEISPERKDNLQCLKSYHRPDGIAHIPEIEEKPVYHQVGESDNPPPDADSQFDKTVRFVGYPVGHRQKDEDLEPQEYKHPDKADDCPQPTDVARAAKWRNSLFAEVSAYVYQLTDGHQQEGDHQRDKTFVLRIDEVGQYGKGNGRIQEPVGDAAFHEPKDCPVPLLGVGFRRNGRLYEIGPRDEAIPAVEINLRPVPFFRIDLDNHTVAEMSDYGSG